MGGEVILAATEQLSVYVLKTEMLRYMHSGPFLNPFLIEYR